jgi:LysM domain
MAFRKFSGLLLTVLFSSALWAETLQVNPSHPDQYTVVEGDTLWDISGKFLNNPWQWPQLWQSNKQIANPNLIYPGDTIYFSMVNGTPQLSLSRGESSFDSTKRGPCILQEKDYINGRTEFRTSEDGKLLPCIREVPLNQAIKLLPSEKIRSFLSSPKVVNTNEISNSAYIISASGEHLVSTVGDLVYARPMFPARPTKYTVYRPGMAYIRPETKELLGYEAAYVADVTLQVPGDPATLIVDKSKGEIRKGDRLMKNEDEQVSLSYFPRPPEKKLTSSIISVLGGVSQIGKHDIVVIDRGRKDGLLPGHQMEIYRRGKIIIDTLSKVKNDAVKLPDEHAGTLMVFRPFEQVSYALVMKATQAIHVLDKVQTP